MSRDVYLGDQTKRVSRKHLLLSKSAQLRFQVYNVVFWQFYTILYIMLCSPQM